MGKIEVSDEHRVAYRYAMTACRKGQHDQCAGFRDPTSSVDPWITLCTCCDADHREEERGDIIREEEWRPGRNFIRKGDPVKVKGRRGTFTFRARCRRNGDEWIEVYDPYRRLVSVRPDTIRRVAKTRGGGR